jgi:hypothetical protein
MLEEYSIMTGNLRRRNAMFLGLELALPLAVAPVTRDILVKAWK